MYSTQINKCPICGTENPSHLSKCQRCFWDFSSYAPNNKMSSRQILHQAENWAKKAFQKIKKYKQERNELQKKMEESLNFTKELLEIKMRLSDIEKQLESLANQGSVSPNLKEEIVSELKHHIENIIQESLNINKQNSPSIKINKNNEISETEFINYEINEVRSQSGAARSSLKNTQEFHSNQQIDSNEQYIIEKYYNEPNFLEQYAYKVTPTKKTFEDIYLNKANEIIFEESNQNDYWIIQLSTGQHCLLPDLNLKINTNLKTIRTIFETRNYHEPLSKNFQIIKTAKVSEINNQWRLLDKGILQF